MRGEIETVYRRPAMQLRRTLKKWLIDAKLEWGARWRSRGSPNTEKCANSEDRGDGISPVLECSNFLRKDQ